ncbi:hypothetical protein MDAP_002179 [Mitosporidium daphniae]
MQLDGIVPTSEMCELLIQTFAFHVANSSARTFEASPELVVKDPVAYELGLQALEVYSLMLSKGIPVTAVFVKYFYFLLEHTGDLELLFWIVPNPDASVVMTYESKSISDRLKVSSDAHICDANFDEKCDDQAERFAMDGKVGASSRLAPCSAGTHLGEKDHETALLGYSQPFSNQTQTAGGGKYDIKFSELPHEIRCQQGPASTLSPSDHIWLITEIFKKYTKRLNFFFMMSHLLYSLKLIEKEGDSLPGICGSFSKGLPTQLLASKELSLLISHWMQWLRSRIFPTLTKMRRISLMSFIFGTIGILQGSIFVVPVPTFSEFIKYCDKLLVDRYLSVTAFRGPSKFCLSTSGAVDLSSFVLPLARDIGYSIYGTCMPSSSNAAHSHHPLYEPSFHALVMSCFLRLQCNKAAIEYFQLFCLPHTFICYDPSINALLLKALIETGQDARALKSFHYLQTYESKMQAALQRDLNSKATKDEYRPISPLLPALSVIFPVVISSGKMRMAVFLFQKYVLPYKPLIGFEGDCPFSVPYSDLKPQNLSCKKTAVAPENSDLSAKPAAVQNDGSSSTSFGLYPYEMFIIYSIFHSRIGKRMVDDQSGQQKSSLLPSDVRLLHLLLLWLQQWALVPQVQEILTHNNLLGCLIKTLESITGSPPNLSQNVVSFRMDPCSSHIEEDLNCSLKILKRMQEKKHLYSALLFSYKWCDFKFNPFSIVVQRAKSDSI